MKKILVALLLSTAALMAANAKKIVGFEYGMGTLNQTYGTTSTADNSTLTTYGLKLGAKEDNMRLCLTYRLQTIAYSSSTKYGNLFGAEFDYFLQMGPIGIFAGPVAGYADYDFIGQDTIARNQTGAYYGLEAGLTFTFGHIELEAGGRYTYYNATNDSVSTQVYSIDNVLTYYASLNYVY